MAVDGVEAGVVSWSWSRLRLEDVAWETILE
jgi:hypothetical protein